MKCRPALACVAASIVASITAIPAPAATLPPGFTERVIAGGLSNPTAMAIAPDGRVFICQQGGQLRVVKDGSLLAAPFVTLTVNSSGERGLLGVAFDPAFETNGFVYVYYTATSPTIHNRVSRFTAAGDVAAPGSEFILMDLEPLGATNHNGGAIHFGDDGKLYVAVGENAVGSNSQILTNRLGKMLRINANGTIPADNPFFDEATGANRSIWALGCAPTQFVITTTNRGYEITGASATRLYRSANGSIDAGDELLGTVAVPSLAPGESHTQEIVRTLPAGTYFLILRADATAAVAEANEANNLQKVKKGG